MDTRLSRAIPRPLKEGIKEALQRARYARLALLYRRSVRQRRARYADQELGFETGRVGGQDVGAAARELARNGCVHLKDVFDPQALAALEVELEAAREAQTLLPVARGAPDTGGMGPVLSSEELGRGEEYVATQTQILYVRDPFVTCPSTLPFVFSDVVIDIAAAAYGCPPALAGGKLMKSYRNDLPKVGFYNFHCDSQSTRLIKFFVYLRDVDENGGPFCYVCGSHLKKPGAWRRRPFWSDEAIRSFYGEGAIRRFSARAGDLIVANTVGFHKAGKTENRERLALLITTGVHPMAEVRLPRSSLASLSPKQRALADMADLV